MATSTIQDQPTNDDLKLCGICATRLKLLIAKYGPRMWCPVCKWKIYI